jgi:hypothetical protein
LENKRAPVLLEYPQGQGLYVVSTLAMQNLSDAHVELYRKLLTNLGLKIHQKLHLTIPAFTGQVLIKALVLGRFGANSLEEALATRYIDEETVRPVAKGKMAGCSWILAANEGDRFIFNQLKQGGPEKIYAGYFSYWVFCPLDLSDLLNSGPDLPKVSQICFISDLCKVYLNGKALKPTASVAAEYRARQSYQDLPLKKGWNHFLVKVASDSLLNADPGTLAVRLFSTNKAFDEQLKSAVQLPQAAVTGGRQ